MLLVTYGIDAAVYDHPRSIHNIALTTTIYSFGMKKLVHMQHGELVQTKLENRLRRDGGTGGEIPSERFLLDNGKGAIEALTRDEFEKKRARFGPNRGVKEQEILEHYCYTDTRGQQAVAAIAITREADRLSAVIDFESVSQYERFVRPAWLICLNEDEAGRAAL